MRRKDREMDREFALMVLDKCEWATLATVNVDGSPYCVPVSIVRDGEWIYFHSAMAGQKAENLRQNSQVCLTAVGDVQRALREFTTAYECAVVHGRAVEVTQETEKWQALRLLCQHHVPTYMDRFEEEVSHSLARTGVWKIHMDTVTGKCKKWS